MIDLAITLYSVFLFILYKTSPDRGERSVFGFRKLTFLLAAAEIPYLFSVSHRPELLHPYIQAHLTDIELVFLKFLWMKALFMTAFSISAFHLSRRYRPRVQTPKAGEIRPENAASLDLQLAFLMLFLTVFTFGILINEVGGITQLLLSWATKTEALRGTALYRLSNLAFGTLAIGFTINYIGRKKRVSGVDLLFLAVVIVIVLAVLLSVGERKNPVLVVIYTMLTWQFRVRPIRVFSVRNVFLFFIFMALAALFPELRKPDGMEIFFSQPGQILSESLGNWGQIFARVSDVDTSLFIYSYFDSLDKFWFGATWGDLFTGLIPSSLLPTKPPIDEGVYIYALAHYYNIHPPVPFRELIPVGWPVSRVTGPFVQFGSVGVVFGGFATGWVIQRIARATLRTRSPAPLFIYAWTMFTGFGLTNAFLFNLAAILVLLMPVHWLYRHGERKKHGAAQRQAFALQAQKVRL